MRHVELMSPWCLKAVQRGLLGVVVLMLIVSLTTDAYPFSRGAPVTEVTPNSFNDFVNTHKPVVVLFYAPWCGHCKNFEPEFIRFAEAVKGTVRVGAVNADAHSSLGQQFGVRGFPTIKYWKAGKKAVNDPQEYQGPRTAAALQQLITRDITNENVHTSVASVAALEALVKGSAFKRVAALFSRKSKVPAMFSVLSLSRQLESLPFVFVGGDDGAARTVQSALGVTDLPAVALIAWNKTSEALQLVPYTRKTMLYEPIAKFFRSCATTTTDVADDGPFCGDAQTDRSGDEGARTQVLDEDSKASHASGKSSTHIQRERARVPPPVPGLAFTAEWFTTFCSPAAPKIAGAAPLCVVVTTATPTEAQLDTLYATFAHEPVLFFTAKTDAEREAVNAFLSSTAQLSLDEGNVRTAAVAYRHARDTVLRYKRVAHFDTLADEVQKVLSGDARLDTQHLG